MGVKWETIPATVQTALERSIESNINEFRLHQLLFFLRGSEGMGFNWVESLELKQTIYETIATHYTPSVHYREKVSPFLSLLGRAGVKWMELPEDLKNNLLIVLEKECRKPLVVAEQVGDIVYG
jgi:prophage antirepressor-like protein